MAPSMGIVAILVAVANARKHFQEVFCNEESAAGLNGNWSSEEDCREQCDQDPHCKGYELVCGVRCELLSKCDKLHESSCHSYVALDQDVLCSNAEHHVTRTGTHLRNVIFVSALFALWGLLAMHCRASEFHEMEKTGSKMLVKQASRRSFHWHKNVEEQYQTIFSAVLCVGVPIIILSLATVWFPRFPHGGMCALVHDDLSPIWLNLSTPYKYLEINGSAHPVPALHRMPLECWSVLQSDIATKETAPVCRDWCRKHVTGHWPRPWCEILPEAGNMFKACNKAIGWTCVGMLDGFTRYVPFREVVVLLYALMSICIAAVKYRRRHVKYGTSAVSVREGILCQQYCAASVIVEREYAVDSEYAPEDDPSVYTRVNSMVSTNTTKPSEKEVQLSSPFASRFASCPQATYKFKPGAMGIDSIDNNGFVQYVDDGGQAQTLGIKRGHKIVNVGIESYSEDVLARAQKSDLSYEVTFQVGPLSHGFLPFPSCFIPVLSDATGASLLLLGKILSASVDPLGDVNLAVMFVFDGEFLYALAMVVAVFLPNFHDPFQSEFALAAVLSWQQGFEIKEFFRIQRREGMSEGVWSLVVAIHSMMRIGYLTDALRPLNMISQLTCTISSVFFCIPHATVASDLLSKLTDFDDFYHVAQEKPQPLAKLLPSLDALSLAVAVGRTFPSTFYLLCALWLAGVTVGVPMAIRVYWGMRQALQEDARIKHAFALVIAILCWPSAPTRLSGSYQVWRHISIEGEKFFPSSDMCFFRKFPCARRLAEDADSGEDVNESAAALDQGILAKNSIIFDASLYGMASFPPTFYYTHRILTLLSFWTFTAISKTHHSFYIQLWSDAKQIWRAFHDPLGRINADLDDIGFGRLVVLFLLLLGWIALLLETMNFLYLKSELEKAHSSMK